MSKINEIRLFSIFRTIFKTICSTYTKSFMREKRSFKDIAHRSHRLLEVNSNKCQNIQVKK